MKHREGETRHDSNLDTALQDRLTFHVKHRKDTMTGSLIRATTRTLPATNTDGTRVKVTLSTGESATYPHNYQLHGPDFHADCALKLARQSQFTDAEDVKYTITSHNDSGYVISLWPATLEQQ